ncbi:carboxypeptidase-like regulatory domain-containing protein [Litoribacillus peritrichatus]|uniref:Lipoprotein n=1 Tax=Litoribacillus peritrichatus TaxID=718191 RepID=A0ABP7N3Y7_9GAMM
MKKLISAFTVSSLSIVLSGCFLDDLSNVQKVSVHQPEETSHRSVAIDDEFGIIANQVIKNRGAYWAKDAVLPAINNTQSGEGVNIRDGMAIVADSPSSTVKIFAYSYDDELWHQEIVIHEPRLSYFGESVYVDREWAVVGAPWAGTVVIYQREEDEEGTQWSEQARLTVDSGSEMEFGASVDKEGDALFVSAYKGDRVYVYELEGQTWQVKQVLDHKDNSRVQPKQFGWSLDAHENYLAIGAYRDQSFENGSVNGGVVHIYKKQDGLWNLDQSVKPFIEGDIIAGGAFGHNLEMNKHNLLVGDNVLRKIFRYTQEHGSWKRSNVIEAPEGASSDFGYHLAINTHNLLTGGSSALLMGPKVTKRVVTGRVTDPNGNVVANAIVSGMLADVTTDVTGVYQESLPLGWYGSLTGQFHSIPSQPLQVNPITKDVQLNDIQLNEVPLHSVHGRISGVFGPVKFLVTGFDEPVVATRFLSIRLPNGWSGEIRPVSETHQFTPEKLVIEKMSQNKVTSFRGSPVN